MGSAKLSCVMTSGALLALCASSAAIGATDVLQPGRASQENEYKHVPA